MTRLWRLLAIAAALNVTAGAALAAAQTVLVRNAPPGVTVELLLGDAVVGTSAASPAGEATFDLKLPEPGELDANILVDVCEKSRRVVVIDHNKRPSPSPVGCDRREISGIFWVRRVNTLVVDVGPAQPSMLLVKGDYKPPKAPPAEGEAAAPKRPSPKGITLFGGSGLGSFREALFLACGNAPGCDGNEGGFGYSFGSTVWITRWLGAQGGYIKPRTVKATGGDDTFSFDQRFKVDIFTVSAKVGIPAGIVRPYGLAGVNFHQSTTDLTETIDAATQTFQQKTHGWGPHFGGGIEVWATPKVALYGEVTMSKLKANAENGGEGKIDERLRFLGFGVRILLSR